MTPFYQHWCSLSQHGCQCCFTLLSSEIAITVSPVLNYLTTYYISTALGSVPSKALFNLVRCDSDYHQENIMQSEFAGFYSFLLCVGLAERVISDKRYQKQ